MSLSAEKLAALLASIQALTAALKAQLDGKLDATAQAVDSAKLGGKTLAEIIAQIDAASAEDLAALQTVVNTFIARTDNPHNVTKAQVGLGNVDNFGTASDADAVAGTAADKFLVAKNLAAFWADKVGTAPDTLDTISEIAQALQNNPDVISSLQSLVNDNKTALDALTLVVDDKLGKADTAADSNKLGGKTLAELEADIAGAGDGSATLAAAKQYTDEQTATKLDATAQAADSAKLNGKTEEQLNTARDAAITAITDPLSTRVTALEEAVGGGSDFLTAESDLAANPVTMTFSTEPEAVEETHSLKEWFQGLAASVTAVGTAANTADSKATQAQTDATAAGTAAAAAQTAADTADGKAVAAQSAADAAAAAAATKLDATAQAADSAKLEGKTLAEIKSEISSDIDLAAVTGGSSKTIQQLDDEKLDKASKASAADITTGTADDKYVTPLGLKSKTDAQDLAITAVSDSMDDLVDQLTAAFNTAADDIEGDTGGQVN